jgi:hypothetical protein
VYRGNEEADLIGKYIYADFCSGIFWALAQNMDGQWSNERLGQFQTQEFVTFGEDVNGELYVAGIGNGQIFKVTSLTSGTSENAFETAWTISPNPADNRITVSAFKAPSGKIRACIVDVQGTIVREFDMPAESSTELDISDLPQGSYWIKPLNGQNKGSMFIKYE